MSFDNFHIVLFDGICNLCDGTVQWIIRHDKQKKFKFIALQSEVGKQLINKLNISYNERNSVIYINSQGYFTRSTAILEILYNMDNGMSKLYFLRFIPIQIRNGVYDLIAKTRYKVFGKKEYCEVPQDMKKNCFVLSDEELNHINL